MHGAPLLDFALHHLTLGRAALYAAILSDGDAPSPGTQPQDQRRNIAANWETARRELDAAVSGLRRSGDQDALPRGLLTRAWCSFAEAWAHKLGGDAQEVAHLYSQAQDDLDEAWEIAERGPMRLHMADIHLYRARLFGKRIAESRDRKDEMQYPWESPAADLAAAEKLINDCGYHRRDEELADAKAAILSR
jgi:hypothetical protein